MRRLFSRADPYILAILCMVGLATVLPAQGAAAEAAGWLTRLAVGVLFFLYGARLSTEEALSGLRHWRLHGVIFALTFVVFPLLGLALHFLLSPCLSAPLAAGLLFLTLLPSTVQSSIAFTSMAKGNVAAAICAASFSNLAGVLLTPLLVGLFLSSSGGGLDLDSIYGICLQLLAPFVAGQVLRRWIGVWVKRHKKALSFVDKGSILLVVYTAFSEGVSQGIWNQVSAGQLILVLAVSAALLAMVMLASAYGGRSLGFNREDRIAILFCGSKKSLASGVPMATLLFGASQVGLVILPLMIFHQVQLIVCAQLARRYGRHAAERVEARA